MQPVAHKLFPGHAFRLRNFRFVMREDVIYSAAMDIDLIAQDRCGHRATLDVPPGTTRPPRRIPFHVAVFFVPRFPKREIADMLLVVFVILHAAGRL